MSEPSLIAQGVYKSFGQGALAVDVLSGVNLSINKGETVAIIGSSGSGKSTLMYLLGGLDLPDRGQVIIDGRQLSALSEHERDVLRNRSLGFVYQFHHLLPEFSVQENVAMPLLIRRQRRTTAMAKAADILDKVGLYKRLRHKPGELSGGERQRAAIARALVTAPTCVLADEPTGNLDEGAARQVFDLIQSINQMMQTSLVIVTHNMVLAGKMGRVFELHNGVLRCYDADAH